MKSYKLLLKLKCISVSRCVQSGGVEARWACPKYKESGCPATFSTRIAMADTEPGPGGTADTSIQDTRWILETCGHCQPSLASYYRSYMICHILGLIGLVVFKSLRA